MWRKLLMRSIGILENRVSFIVNRDSFLTHHSQIYIQRRDKQIVRAYEVNLDYKTYNITSTLGEFFEREVLINSNKIKNKKLIAVSMIDGEKRYIDTNRVVSNGRFVDSCGMASHVLSEKLIKAAFFEFFERQSLIFNYLSQSVGKRLDIKACKELMNYDSYIKNFVDKIQYFNITIDSAVNVVLAIALGNEKKAIGLGTDINIRNAILKSQKEILQNFAVDCTKYDNKDIGFDSHNNSEEDTYYNNFLSLSVEEIENKYMYLNDSQVEVIKENNTMEFNLKELLVRIKENYGINPYVVFINSKRLINNLKVIKIIDFNWFPHMRPEIYSKSIYEYIENKTGKVLLKNEKIIPFP